ncbi:GNAT family N-acetyltransferase [Prochlorococcus marinus XMU1419]|uniref:GNAT family N-acetyltransferase n=1 Tax=Prochlorococcus marinus TaxID=1219 RepID=UPI001ADB548E|nr:GNAT family N-acetyltransferase [Prochlorococcus marinus]MBO8234266.1 GNAT family N-acetyltransferase [Prochlorococcus marinus XMU1419]MBW3075956.1 hypothetical protein [Prochlorococcus marinus str. XMU1419]
MVDKKKFINPKEDKLILRWANDNDLENVNAFYNKYYKTNRTINQAKWIFINKIIKSKDKFLAIAELNGEIVGTQALIPMIFRLDKRTFFTAKSEETLVIRKAYKYNTFSRLYEFILVNIEKYDFKFIWGFTPKIKSFNRIGFSSPYQTKSWIKLIRSDALQYYLSEKNNYLNYLSFISRIIIFYQLVISFITNLIYKVRSNRKNFILIKDIKFSEELFLTYVNNINKNNKDIFIERNKDFFSWRFAQNPFCKPITIFAFDHSKSKLPLGYIFFGMNEDRRACIIDFSIKDNTNGHKIGNALINELEKRVFNMGAHSIYTWDPNINNSIFRNCLRRKGFIFFNKGSDFVFKNISNDKRYNWENLSENFLFTRLMNLGSIF